MSQPPELPDLDKLEAEARECLKTFQYVLAEPDKQLALIQLARRAQPEGEAPQADPFMYAISAPDGRAYFGEHCVDQDENALAVEAEMATLASGEKHRVVPVYLAAPVVPNYEELTEHLRQFQHNDGSGVVFGYDKAGIDRMMARALAARPAAQHAESGAQAAIPTWQERAQELGFSGRRQGYPDTDEQESLKAAEIADLRAALAAQSQGAQQAAAPGAEPVEPPRMTTDESRDYLVTFMEKHFTDKTYHRYIRGQRGSVNLAGDFAWQMARALRMLEAAPSARGTPEAPALLMQALTTGIPMQEPVYIAKALRAQRQVRVSLAGGTGPSAAAFLANIQMTPWTYTKETAEAYAEGYNRAIKDYRAALLDVAAQLDGGQGDDNG